jgi:hypothetical protein
VGHLPKEMKKMLAYQLLNSSKEPSWPGKAKKLSRFKLRSPLPRFQGIGGHKFDRSEEPYDTFLYFYVRPI